jgi:hypothetical protein
MKILRHIGEQIELLTESTEANGGKNYYIKGIYLQSEVQNKNKRKYPEEILDNEVERYIKEKVDTNMAYGELGHPDNPSSLISRSINLDRVSHRIVELVKEGKNWIGKSIVGDTPCGKIVKGLIEMGGKLGVSSRGLGTLKSESSGLNVVQSDYQLITAADVVADPSAPDAFVDAIMENVEWVYDIHGVLVPVLEGYKKEILSTSKRELEQKQVEIMKDFISKIKNI